MKTPIKKHLKLLSVSITPLYFICFILFIGHANIRNSVIYSSPHLGPLFVCWKVGSVKKDFGRFVLHFISSAQDMPGTVST